MKTLTAILALALITVPAFASVLNVKDYGAVADGKTDDTPAFQKALAAAAAVPGSTVFASAGKYMISGSIQVPGSTILSGEYRGPGRQRGTILLSTYRKGESEGPGCIVMSGGSGVNGLAIEYPEQFATAKEPIAYPYAIYMAGDTRVEDVFLYNAYQGINMDGAHANLVRNVWGEPLKIGINSDHTYDISRIENVHFWPYFTLNKPMRSWVQRFGVAFQFGRSDWQSVSNTFCYGYRTGYRFYTATEIKEKGYPAGATNGSFVGIGADCVGVALDIEDSFVIGVSITNGEFAPFGGSNTRGVLMHKGNTGNLTLVNCNFWAVSYNVAEVQSGSLNMSSCNIHEWGGVQKDAPCFAVSGGRLNVNACTFNKGGLLATLEGPDTKALFSGNMGTDPLKVTNLIGDRAVFGANNPRIESDKALSTGKKKNGGMRESGQNLP